MLSPMRTIGLARVTVASPQRRVDIALPEQSSVAELLPGLLRHARVPSDQPAEQSAWVLRRADGTVLEPGRQLGSYRIADGEVLHLAPQTAEWPEAEYDDLVDVIASSSGRTGRSWTPRHTRTAGLTAGAALLLLGLVAVLQTSAPLWAFTVTCLLLFAAVAMARAGRDAGAGALLGLMATPYAFASGALLFAGGLPPLELGAPHLLSGFAVAFFVAVAAAVGTGAATVGYCAVASACALGGVGCWLSTWDVFEPYEVAGIVVSAILGLSPALGSLAVRLGRVPMPALPRNTSDLVRDDPQPPRPIVYDAVVRAYSLLTGVMAGCGAVIVGCLWVLTAHGDVSSVVLVAVVSLGCALRARLYPIVWQRLPWLVAGAAGLVALALGPLFSAGDPLLIGGPAVLGAGAVLMLIGLTYSRQLAKPYLGRYAELLELFVVLAVAPVLCSVLGLYDYVRGLGG